MRRSTRRPVTIDQEGRDYRPSDVPRPRGLAGPSGATVGGRFYEWWNPDAYRREQEAIYGPASAAPGGAYDVTTFSELAETAAENTLANAQAAGDALAQFMHFAKWALIGGAALYAWHLYEKTSRRGRDE